MRSSIHRDATKRTPGFSEELLYEFLVCRENEAQWPAAILLKDGALLAGFWFEGVDLEVATPRQLAFLRWAVNDAFQGLDGNWMLHVESMPLHRREYINGSFCEPIDQVIDEERRDRAVHLQMHTALFLTYRPPAIERTASGQKLMHLLSGNEEASPESTLDRQLEQFERTLGRVAEALGRVLSIRRMRSTKDNCELLQALNYMINGRWRTCRPPARGMYLDTLLAYELFVESDVLHYAGDYVAVVSVLGYPVLDDSGPDAGLGTFPGALDGLVRLGIEYRCSHRFIVLDYQGADVLFGKYRKAWARLIRPFMAQVTNNASAPVDEDAKARVQEVDRAKSDLNRRQKLYGHHTCVVVVRGSDRTQVVEHAKLVIRSLEQAGFKADLERLNALEAFKGTFPGHGYENVRKPVINTVNLADLMPLNLEWGGELISPNPRFPSNSPPLLQARTISGAAFRLHLHHQDLGNTFVIGPPGAGKSTLLAALASQWGRYPDARVIVFDRGNSMLPLALARRDAIHYSLGSEDGPRLAPLASLETHRDRAQALEWLLTAFRAVELSVSNEQIGSIQDALDLFAESTYAPAERTLTSFLSQLQDPTLRSALRFYTSGPGANVMNGDSDALRYKRFTVFELDQLFQLGADKVAIPTLLYVCSQIKKSLTGDPTLIIFDEALSVIGDTPIAQIVKDWLLTLRKLNAAVVLSTQSLSHILESPIRNAVLESCPTRILLPNAEAASASMRSLYADYLRLSPEQIDRVASGVPKKHYYYVGPERSRMFSLDLGPAALTFLGSGSPQELRRARTLWTQFGADWPAHRLIERGQAGWAARFRALGGIDEVEDEHDR